MEQPPGTGHTLHAGERPQPRAVGGGDIAEGAWARGEGSHNNSGSCRLCRLRPPHGEDSKPAPPDPEGAGRCSDGWHPQPFALAASMGTPARARDLRSFPELSDHEQRQETNGREEGRAPRAGIASGPQEGAESWRSRYPPRLPEPWPKTEASAPHAWKDGRAVSEENVFNRSLNMAKS